MTRGGRLAIGAAALGTLAVAALVHLREPRVEPVVTSSGLALTPLCGAAVRSQCGKRVECGRMDRGQLDACLEEIGADCERSLGWKLRAGVVSTGGEPQHECLEALDDASCNALAFMLADDEPDLFEMTGRCEMAEMLQPHSGLGDPCAESADCTSGYCPGLAPECHRCRAFVAEGQPCKPGLLDCDPAKARCVPGPGGAGLCDPLSADGIACSLSVECRSRACRQAATSAGRVCAPAPAGTACAEARDCASGSYCRIDAGRGVCAPSAKNGDACTGEPGACAEREAGCVGGRCQVRPFALPKGEACRDFSDCKPGLFCKGARGGAGTGRCTPQAAAGASCAALDFGGCSADSTCLGNRCQKLRGAGEKCSGPYQCKNFLSCVPTSPTQDFAAGAVCAPDSVVGQPCGRSLRCTGSYCDAGAGKCVPLAVGGRSCKVSEECESRWCIGDDAGGGTCYAPCAGPLR